MKQIPNKIYLQLFGNSEPSEHFKDIDAANVTWSLEKVNLSDVAYHRLKSPWIDSKDEKPETLAMLANCSLDCFVLVQEKDYLSGTIGHYRGDRNQWVALLPNSKGGYEEKIADVRYWMPMPTVMSKNEIK